MRDIAGYGSWWAWLWDARLMADDPNPATGKVPALWWQYVIVLGVAAVVVVSVVAAFGGPYMEDDFTSGQITAYWTGVMAIATILIAAFAAVPFAATQRKRGEEAESGTRLNIVSADAVRTDQQRQTVVAEINATQAALNGLTDRGHKLMEILAPFRPGEGPDPALWEELDHIRQARRDTETRLANAQEKLAQLNDTVGITDSIETKHERGPNRDPEPD
jgi:NhaP-type Na+/H+ or K+/H+ antiporter